jgi:hypothetical protein
VEQNYLPADLTGTSFYEAGTEGQEPDLTARWLKRRQQGLEISEVDRAKDGGKDDNE